MANPIRIANLTIGEKEPFFLIAGPCVIEDSGTTLKVADFLRETSELLDVPVIFKTSYDKANRTSLDSYRGPGLGKGLDIIRAVKEKTGLPVLSDVHEPGHVKKVAKVLDVIQIPAFLCRQTDLLLAAGLSGLPINLKKGQFISPWAMEGAVRKVTSTGNRSIILTERGASFGYNNLVVDIRSIPIMKNFGFPVVFDGTHSVQLPGSAGKSSGGQREFVEPLSKAAVAAGADGIFLEVHPKPDKALCDGPNSLPLEQVRPLVAILKEIHGLVRAAG
ncbi:MAG: 3-deoxy-8-phosphooctulonate synthase [Deltaproteobacteria bacterium]|nr:3-deoxy-8-phosphooctulonate synthase [Deltaproteobacteria bacterium]MBW2137790.1 3-deoxy-8-phosphooctulonate synthase [Deltaproteobacteria bacterium]